VGKIGTEYKRLDLIICDHCKKNFDDQEHLYEISHVKFDLSDVLFDPVVVNLQDLVNELPSIRKVIRFHKDCLCELAGTGWLI